MPLRQILKPARPGAGAAVHLDAADVHGRVCNDGRRAGRRPGDGAGGHEHPERALQEPAADGEGGDAGHGAGLPEPVRRRRRLHHAHIRAAPQGARRL